MAEAQTSSQLIMRLITDRSTFTCMNHATSHASTVHLRHHAAIAGPTFPEASALTLDAAPKAGKVCHGLSIKTELPLET